ncbi:MAG: thiamine monophosphate kinase [Sulfuricurvum sp. PC08-66]|nr:MAG: thiamine monophosphate kinase [Sulfuricurvum sp. PC08-66]
MNTEQFIINAFAHASRHIGDDGAVVGEWVYSQDAFFEDVHFKRAWLTPYQIGYKAAIVNLSDAIAMHARPRYALLTLALPKAMRHSEIGALIEGIQAACKAHNCEMIGGDTIANASIALSMTIIAQTTKPLYRHTARKGEMLFYTGHLGQSQKTLRTLQNGGRASSIGRFVRPQLRSAFVERAYRVLGAGMDISDGLLTDAQKLCASSGVGYRLLGTIDAHVACSGEEYEILGSCAPRNKKALIRRARVSRTTVTFFAKTTRNRPKERCKAHHF